MKFAYLLRCSYCGKKDNQLRYVVFELFGTELHAGLNFQTPPSGLSITGKVAKLITS